MIRKFQYPFLILVLSGTVVSCKRDKEDPVIEILQPAANSTHVTGTELHVEVAFSDDRELSFYQVYIGDEAGEKQPEFDLIYTQEISVDHYHLHEHEVIPGSIDAVYYLHASATDAEGKMTSTKIKLNFTE